ncbi:hypothetical protein ABT160_06810 [Streptomyces sp. NPDC001941]|uniref:hypothetical protein n=1 Tax=Streptomyces sp. NPDC001941 TaxID=3154659 RepID=UPI0033248DEC
MTVDPTEPETFGGPEQPVDATDVETPEADAAEQQADLVPATDEPLTGLDPATADVGDLTEQARVVALDEDDYR